MPWWLRKLPELERRTFDLLLAEDWKLVFMRKSLLLFFAACFYVYVFIGLPIMLCGAPIDRPTLFDCATGLWTGTCQILIMPCCESCWELMELIVVGCVYY